MPNQMPPGWPMQAPGQWQPAPKMPPLAQLAAGAGVRPLTARGVSAGPPAKFVMPSPESLGVKVQAASAPPIALAPQVDWNAIQARLDRVGVLKYEKDRQTGGVSVTILVPNAGRTLAQPITARAETEAAAILLALQTAESWLRHNRP